MNNETERQAIFHTAIANLKEAIGDERIGINKVITINGGDNINAVKNYMFDDQTDRLMYSLSISLYIKKIDKRIYRNIFIKDTNIDDWNETSARLEYMLRDLETNQIELLKGTKR